METPLISVESLTVDFSGDLGAFRAVDGVSFTIPHGRIVAMVGESGSGKTVTANAILRLLPKQAQITGGRILFRDPQRNDKTTDLVTLNPSGSEILSIRGGRIAMIFQEPMSSLSPLHTIGDQVLEALTLHSEMTTQEAELHLEQTLTDVGFPDPKRAIASYPFELSGGLRQRAMIAMALIARPVLVIADEPTTALDVTTQAQILALIKRLQQASSMAMLLITHDLGIVANMADEVVVLYRGQVMESGPMGEIFRHPQHPYLKALMRAVPRLAMDPDERLQPLREIRRALPMEGPPNTVSHKGPILRAAGLRKSFASRGDLFGGAVKTVHAVNGVSLSLAAGTTLGLVGESGCGKTTVAKMILRAIEPDAGQVFFDAGDGHGERDVLAFDDPELSRFRRAVQFIFQDPFSSLNPRMTVYELLTEPLVIYGIGSPEDRYRRAKELLDWVGLDRRSLGRYPHSFSGGQRQRLGIARALALSPRVLLCDEPVSALDVSVQAQILNLLKDLQTSLGLSYIFVSHNLAVVDYIADYIAVMCRGYLVEEAPREKLFANPVHPYTQALLAAVPDANIDRPLDFAKLKSGRFSDPSRWALPFFLEGDETGAMIEIEPGHRIRVNPTHADTDFFTRSPHPVEPV